MIPWRILPTWAVCFFGYFLVRYWEKKDIDNGAIFFTNLKRTFNSGNILAKLIYINVGLFVIIRLASVILMLFNLGGFPFLQYLQVPSSPELLLYRPWTIITYMFTHFDFLHILFNMLWLYWFGGLFLTFSVSGN